MGQVESNNRVVNLGDASEFMQQFRERFHEARHRDVFDDDDEDDDDDDGYDEDAEYEQECIPDVLRGCEYCERTPSYRCGGCKVDGYCSRDCQSECWLMGDHKDMCMLTAKPTVLHSETTVYKHAEEPDIPVMKSYDEKAPSSILFLLSLPSTSLLINWGK